MITTYSTREWYSWRKKGRLSKRNMNLTLNVNPNSSCRNRGPKRNRPYKRIYLRMLSSGKNWRRMSISFWWKRLRRGKWFCQTKTNGLSSARNGRLLRRRDTSRASLNNKNWWRSSLLNQRHVKEKALQNVYAKREYDHKLKKEMDLLKREERLENV
jgi:hypothetical protein